MRACDVFLFPSLRDGGGLVVVEAMAAGKPVICVDLGGPRMHVTEDCGVKVAPLSPEQVVGDLAAALERLCRDKELRLQMGARPRASAQSGSITGTGSVSACWKSTRTHSVYNRARRR